MRLQPFLRSSADNFDWTGRPHIQTLTITGPFAATGPGRHAEPAPDLHLPARPSRAGGAGVRAADPRPRWRAAPTASRSATRRLAPMLRVLRRRRARSGSFEAGIQRGAAAHPGQPAVPVPRRARSGGARCRRSAVPHQRRRAGVAAVVLPVEQHPGRRAADASPRSGALRSRRCSTQQVRRMLADPRAEALVTNFAGQWLQLRNVRSVQPNSDEFPDFDDNLRQAFRRETELLFASIVREDRSVLDLLTRRLHVRQRAAGASLRDPERLRQPLPPGAGDRRGAPRPARPRQHPGGDLARRAHVAGAARQVGAREPARAAAAAAAADVPSLKGNDDRRRSRGRCASSWRSIAPTRCARAATR